MQLRARGQPEKITKMEYDGQIATTYHHLDDAPKARTADEPKRIAERTLTDEAS